MWIALCVAAVLVAAYFLSVWGRIGHPGMDDFYPYSYAHRGLHADGIPENSMAAFRAALEGGYGVELDVHLLRDGSLAVIHDSLLMRTTGLDGRIEDLTAADLSHCFLNGTKETIPQLWQVLELYQGKYPLIVELKPVAGNHAALTETVCNLLESYKGVYCLESFDPRCLLWLKKHRPYLLRGQLSEDYFHSKTKLPFPLNWILRNHLANWLTKPDFIAYRYSDRNCTINNRLCMRRMPGVSWTVQNQAEYDTAKAEGWIPIFEGFRP